MDWNSPTTKKHIAEAKTQGCELLGKGRNCQYRTYRLPCGHEKEIETGRMRSGRFRCQTCLDNKLIEDAKAQGCVLLGAGKDRNYRTYRLPCGHEQEVTMNAMRLGTFRCQTCLGNKLIAEAEAQGCVLLGAGKHHDYRIYSLSCGHEQEIQVVHIRIGNFSCQTCLNNRLIEEAAAQGCELLGAGRNCQHRTYALPCGHEQEVKTDHIRSGGFRCRTCLDNNLIEEAKAQGCELLGAGKNHNYRNYRLPCGHEKEVQTGLVRSGTFRCQTCLGNKLIAEAEAQGCVLLGSGKDSFYRTYRLSCGHVQEVQVSHIRNSNFRCQVCEDWAFTQPSQTYLLHIKVGPDEWLKLGFAKNIELRISQYGLPSDAVVSVIVTKPFDTGQEAQVFEKSLHKKYKRKRLKAADMAYFHSKQGQTECYPLTLVDRLMAEFRLLG